MAWHPCTVLATLLFGFLLPVSCGPKIRAGTLIARSTVSALMRHDVRHLGRGGGSVEQRLMLCACTYSSPVFRISTSWLVPSGPFVPLEFRPLSTSTNWTTKSVMKSICKPMVASVRSHSFHLNHNCHAMFEPKTLWHMSATLSRILQHARPTFCLDSCINGTIWLLAFLIVTTSPVAANLVT